MSYWYYFCKDAAQRIGVRILNFLRELLLAIVLDLIAAGLVKLLRSASIHFGTALRRILRKERNDDTKDAVHGGSGAPVERRRSRRS